MERVSAKFALCLPTEDQKLSRTNAYCKLKEDLDDVSDFFSMLITDDEGWCCRIYRCGEDEEKNETDGGVEMHLFGNVQATSCNCH